MDFTGIYGVFGDEGVVGAWVPGSLGLRHFAASRFWSFQACQDLSVPGASTSTRRSGYLRHRLRL